MHLPNVNSDDINKFETSSGFFLLVIAGISLYFDSEHQLISIWLKILVAGLGVIVMAWGLRCWRIRQDMLDEKLGLEIDTIKRSLSDSSKTEQEKKMKEKIKNVNDMHSQDNTQSKQTSQQNIEKGTKEQFERLRDLEEKMVDKLVGVNNPNYTARAYQKTSNGAIFDFIYQSNYKYFKDKVIDFRFVLSQNQEKSLDHVLNQMQWLISKYRQFVRKKANIVLVIIYDNLGKDSSEWKYRLLQQARTKSEFQDLRDIQIEFVKTSDIDKFDGNILLPS